MNIPTASIARSLAALNDPANEAVMRAHFLSMTPVAESLPEWGFFATPVRGRTTEDSRKRNPKPSPNLGFREGSNRFIDPNGFIPGTKWILAREERERSEFTVELMAAFASGRAIFGTTQWPYLSPPRVFTPKPVESTEDQWRAIAMGSSIDANLADVFRRDVSLSSIEDIADEIEDHEAPIPRSEWHLHSGFDTGEIE